MGKKILQIVLLIAICVFAFLIISWLLGIAGIVIPQNILIVAGIIVIVLIVGYVLYGTWA